MSRKKHKQNKQRFAGNILYRLVCILFVLTMLTAWLASGILAKYTASRSVSDSARIARGLPKIELMEHEANLVGGVYNLSANVVAKNVYDSVIPGVDIQKDPFIQVGANGAEVSYELYVKVTPSASFPPTVTYALTDKWELDGSRSSGGAFVYKYTDVISSDPIFILKDNKLTVSEDYAGGSKFSLAFSAWLEQIA